MFQAQSAVLVSKYCYCFFQRIVFDIMAAKHKGLQTYT